MSKKPRQNGPRHLHILLETQENGDTFILGYSEREEVAMNWRDVISANDNWGSVRTLHLGKEQLPNVPRNLRLWEVEYRAKDFYAFEKNPVHVEQACMSVFGAQRFLVEIPQYWLLHLDEFKSEFAVHVRVFAESRADAKKKANEIMRPWLPRVQDFRQLNDRENPYVLDAYLSGKR